MNRKYVGFGRHSDGFCEKDGYIHIFVSARKSSWHPALLNLSTGNQRTSTRCGENQKQLSWCKSPGNCAIGSKSHHQKQLGWLWVWFYENRDSNHPMMIWRVCVKCGEKSREGQGWRSITDLALTSPIRSRISKLAWWETVECVKSNEISVAIIMSFKKACLQIQITSNYSLICLRNAKWPRQHFLLTRKRAHQNEGVSGTRVSAGLVGVASGTYV